MMKTLLSICILAGSQIFSQNATILWQQTYGGSSQDYSGEIVKTNDGGFLLLGRSNSSNGDITSPIGDYDFWAVKMDANGAIIWDKNYGNSFLDYGSAVKQTADNGFIMAGYTMDSVIGSMLSINYRIIKTDSAGNTSWNFNYGGTGTEYAKNVIQTSDGEFVVVGQSNSSDYDFSTNVAGQDAWIMKLYPNGTLRWASSYGDSLTDDYSDVLETTSGDLLAVGRSTDTTSSGDGSSDLLISLYDINGVSKWNKFYGGSGNDYGVSVIENNSNSYIIAGVTWSTDRDVASNYGDGDVWILEIDSSGNLLWEKTFGGDSIDLAYDIYKDVDGGFLIASRSVSSANGNVSEANQGAPDWWIFKIDATGSILWEESLGGSTWEDPASLIQDTDGGVVVAGRSESSNGDLSFNNGQADLWIVKLQQPTTTSITVNSNDNTIDVYPNPTSDLLNVKSIKSISSIKIYNSLGVLVVNETVNSTFNQLDLSDFNNGVYHMIITTSANEMNYHEVIIAR